MKTIIAAALSIGAALIALAWPPAATSAELMARPGDFAAVAARLKPGDTLTLVGRFPGPLRPKGALLSGVTIRARGAAVEGLFYPAGAVQGLTIVGGTWAGVRVDGAEGLTVTGGAVFRGPDPADGYGLFVNGGRDVAVTGVAFESFKTAIVLNRVEGFRVEGSGFARMRSDGMTIGESRRGRVAGNVFHGTRITGDEHPDAVQLYSRPASPPTADIVIEDNDVAGMTQGLAGFNHVRNGVDDGGFDRIAVRGNRLKVGFPHAVALYDCRDCRVEGNAVETYPGAAYRASINAVRGSVARCGNRIAPGAGKPGLVDPAC